MSGLEEFLTPFETGMTPTDEPVMRLSPEVQRELARRLREFDLHRARALIAARSVVVR